SFVPLIRNRYIHSFTTRRSSDLGHVEAMVKYVRNNFLLPENRIINIEHFNDSLWGMAEEDRDRLHYDKKVLQSKLFEEDLNNFIMLPEKEFECARYEVLKSDKYGVVSVDKKQYSSSPRFSQ